jgi:NhaP-type Na+/H+ or K+/H+ antiporter
VGFLCILFAIIDHDNRITYGLARKGLVKSLIIGLALIVVQSSMSYALGTSVIDPKLDAFTQSLAQPFPYSIGFALVCGFAYGPLQVFFIIFLSTDSTRSSAPSRQELLIRGRS